jgi:hypothetical protein
MWSSSGVTAAATFVVPGMFTGGERSVPMPQTPCTRSARTMWSVRDKYMMLPPGRTYGAKLRVIAEKSVGTGIGFAKAGVVATKIPVPTDVERLK